jgi:hypothetical protein
MSLSRYLVGEGISLSKEGSISARESFRRMGLPEEEAEQRDHSLLCKVAKSGCLDKTTYLLDQIMAARHAVCKLIGIIQQGK